MFALDHKIMLVLRKDEVRKNGRNSRRKWGKYEIGWIKQRIMTKEG